MYLNECIGFALLYCVNVRLRDRCGVFVYVCVYAVMCGCVDALLWCCGCVWACACVVVCMGGRIVMLMCVYASVCLCGVTVVV